MTSIPGDYRTHKHIPTRSCYQLIIEVGEDLFPLVCDTLGYPRAGENTFVSVELLTPDKLKELKSEQSAKNAQCSPVVKEKLTTEKTKGEKLKQRACILCGEESFQKYVYFKSGDDGLWYEPSEKMATQHIYDVCWIKSRKELVTNEEAQKKFKELDSKYKDWQAQNKYADNMMRE